MGTHEMKCKDCNDGLKYTCCGVMTPGNSPWDPPECCGEPNVEECPTCDGSGVVPDEEKK